MATISKFEDIEAWKLAREMTKTIYAISNDGAFARDFGLRDQIRRASVSIMSNIAEGFERGGDKEFSSSCLWPRVHLARCEHNCMWHWMQIISTSGRSAVYQTWRHKLTECLRGS